MPGRDFILVFIISGLFLSCETPVEPETETDPITELTFRYLQDEGKIFTSARLTDPFNGVGLAFARLVWYGTNGLEHDAPDSIFLNDNGDFGDILKNDHVYSRKLSMVDFSDTNSIAYEDTGIVYLKVLANYANDSVYTAVDSFHLGNLKPKFLWIDAPDTLVLPDSGLARLVDIRAEVKDANGIEDIRWVGFTSRHVDPDTMLNNGDYIFMFDDGQIDHGDVTSGDGIHSTVISFPYNAKTGEIEWAFRVQDQSNAFDDTTHIVLVLE